ncbi:hypothetical protein HOG98_10215 [bacterium]|jgi:hypothetical protein|nr:hypothetical protein [bacterium]
METINQYQADIKNGKLVNEKGSFFRAAPFEVRSEEAVYTIEYIKDHEKEVVYSVKEDGQRIGEYEHPFFVPNEGPEKVIAQFSKSSSLFHAFVVLNITKHKDYRRYFESNSDGLKYTITQKKFL